MKGSSKLRTSGLCETLEDTNPFIGFTSRLEDRLRVASGEHGLHNNDIALVSNEQMLAANSHRGNTTKGEGDARLCNSCLRFLKHCVVHYLLEMQVAEYFYFIVHLQLYALVLAVSLRFSKSLPVLITSETFNVTNEKILNTSKELETANVCTIILEQEKTYVPQYQATKSLVLQIIRLLPNPQILRLWRPDLRPALCV